MNNEQARLKRESVESQSFVVRQNGNQEQLTSDLANSERDPLLKFFLYRELGSHGQGGATPLHIDIMQKMELVGYEPASDIGHFRFYPKGTLMKDLLEDLAEDVAVNRLSATKIHTPILYRTEQKDIAEQAASFHERDYRVDMDDRELLLRFAGDFGLFSMMKDAQVSHTDLPLRVYEISPSFRLEKSGECSGLKRLRSFTMPDIHCFCKDLETALKEYAKLYQFYDGFLNEAQLPFAVAFRTVKDFWKENKQFIVDRLKDSKKDGLIEVLDEMKHYWNLKHEFQYIDSTGDNVQLSTVQLDISDSERYGLNYTDLDGKKKPMVIVHSSMGSVERILGAILEERGKEIKEGRKPIFPYWLSPTQLRLIPVSEKHLDYCDKLVNKFNKVRVDIDDRSESLSKRVRAAEKEWIPAYAVIGDKEFESQLYTLKVRGSKEDFKGISADNIQGILEGYQSTRPFRASYLPKMVSKQLRFGSSY